MFKIFKDQTRKKEYTSSGLLISYCGLLQLKALDYQAIDNSVKLHTENDLRKKFDNFCIYVTNCLRKSTMSQLVDIAPSKGWSPSPLNLKKDQPPRDISVPNSPVPTISGVFIP